MKWLSVAVDTNIFWPTKEKEIVYNGYTFILRPETDNESASVSVCCSDAYFAKALINRFLSALAWVENEGIHEKFITQSLGQRPGFVGKGLARRISLDFNKDYLPVPKDEKTLRALALYREALSVSSPSYQFLGFYKVINVVFPNKDGQISWINNALDYITENRAINRIKELTRTKPNIAEYLYIQCRCAVAHAYSEPVVDPDEPEDNNRLTADLPIIKALAQKIIQDNLGIITFDTYKKQHLYELEGFADLLGKENVDKIRNKENVEAVVFPDIKLRLRKHDPYIAFERLIFRKAGQNCSNLSLLYQTISGLLWIELILNFKDWELIFDPLECIGYIDDKSVTAMYDYNDAINITKEIYRNGIIEVYNLYNNQLLARTDPFIPINIRLDLLVDQLEEKSKIVMEEAEKRKANV